MSQFNLFSYFVGMLVCLLIYGERDDYYPASICLYAAMIILAYLLEL